MAFIIVRVASGGIPVVESATGYPYYEADNGFGIPVTFGSTGIPLGTAGTSGPPPANTLQAGTGSFLVTGVGMSPVVQSLMASDSGSFALTGNSATLTKVSSGATAYTLTSAQGTFVLTGQAATLSYQGFFRQFDMVGGTYINKPTNRQWQVGETYAAGA